MTSKNRGKVYLVGAGPGDPGLLTVKAKECIEQADVVIYDYLANRVFLDYADKKAELIYVGKKAGCHTMSQEDINHLIVEKAGKGLIVVRLKGGDPFIFGRGGEEAQELRQAGVSFEVVPGVTSAIAVPAYSGIPLTHRDYTAAVAFITGHEDPAKEKSNIDWDRLALSAGTLVFLMGVGNLKQIAEKLIRHGRSRETPAAVIQKGTTAGQKTTVGTLEDIYELALAENVKPPAVIVVGDVVNLREDLNWFEKRPLSGKRIVVTRAREQASDFLSGLSQLGAECIEFPSIEVVPPADYNALDNAMERLKDYQWVLFTSVNGVKYFFERLEAAGRDSRSLCSIKVGAIGPKTALALKSKGINPDLVPDEYRAEAVVEAFKALDTDGLNILIPRAAEAREILPAELEKMGASVDVVEAYRTVMPETDRERVKEMLEKGDIDMVTFTSSSTVANFVKMFEDESDKFHAWMSNVPVACIGPVTARTAEDKGLTVNIFPEDYTVEGLTDSIVNYFSNGY